MTNRLMLKTQHSSMQAPDNASQQAHDVEKIFAKGKQFPIKTSTESGPEVHLNEAFKECAQDYGHVVHFARGNVIAVDRKIIKKGSVKKGQVFVAKNDEIYGPGHDAVFATLAFTHVDDRIGRISQAAVHYPTKGTRPNDPNFKIVRRYDQAITKWMVQAGAKEALAFVNGDFNIRDKDFDWTESKLWTSMGDELGKWPNTGHGPIDGFASYNKDGRVKAQSLVVLDDNRFHLYSDHFICRGTWSIAHLKTNCV